MRTRLALTAATLAAGLAVATPAAAQGYYQDYRWGQQYGNTYGYRADMRQLHDQVSQVRRDIWHFSQRGMITQHESRKLDRQAENLQRRIHQMGRYGLAPHEYARAQQGIAKLQHAVGRDIRDRGNGRDDRRWNRGYQGQQYGYRWQGQRPTYGYYRR